MRPSTPTATLLLISLFVVFFLNMKRKFLKLRMFVAVQDLKISFRMQGSVYFIALYFGLVPPHFVCSDDGTVTSPHEKLTGCDSTNRIFENIHLRIFIAFTGSKRLPCFRKHQILLGTVSFQQQPLSKHCFCDMCS